MFKNRKMATKNQLTDIINNKSRFSFGEIFEKGFDYGGKSIGWLLLLFLIIIAYSWGVSQLPYFSILGFSVVDLVGQIFVFSAIGAGMAIFYKNRTENKRFDFADLFRGFQINYPQIILLSVIVYLINYATSYLFSLLLGNQMFSGMGGATAIADLSRSLIENWQGLLGWAAVGFVFQIALYIFLFFSTYFVAVRQLKATEALELSFKLGAKFFFQILFLLILMIIFNMIGALILGIGLIVTVPITMAIFYFSYHTLIEEHVSDDLKPSFDQDILDA